MSKSHVCYVRCFFVQLWKLKVFSYQFFLLEGFCHCYSLVYGFRIEAKKEWTCGWAVPGHDKAKSVLHRKASHSEWCKISCGVLRIKFLQHANMAASGRPFSCPSANGSYLEWQNIGWTWTWHSKKCPKFSQSLI